MNGIWGAIILVAVIVTTYVLVTKKPLGNLMKNGLPAPDDWKKYWKWLFVSIVALGIWWFLSSSSTPPGSPSSSWNWPPSVGDVADFAAKYWLVFVGVVCAGWVLSAVFKDSKLWNSVGIAGMVLAVGLLVGTNTWVFVRDIFLPTPVCQNPSGVNVRECRLNTVWSHWTVPNEGKTNSGMKLCWGPRQAVEMESEVREGITRMRFRAKRGTAVVRYELQTVPNKGNCRDLF